MPSDDENMTGIALCPFMPIRTMHALRAIQTLGLLEWLFYTIRLSPRLLIH